MKSLRAMNFGHWLIAIALALTSLRAYANASVEVDVATARAEIEAKQIRILDVREPSEWKAGVIQGALLIPLGQVEKRVEELAFLKQQPLYVVCASGGRSAQAIKRLSKLGFTQLTNIKGGMNDWYKQKLPVMMP